MAENHEQIGAERLEKLKAGLEASRKEAIQEIERITEITKASREILDAPNDIVEARKIAESVTADMPLEELQIRLAISGITEETRQLVGMSCPEAVELEIPESVRELRELLQNPVEVVKRSGAKKRVRLLQLVKKLKEDPSLKNNLLLAHTLSTALSHEDRCIYIPLEDGKTDSIREILQSLLFKHFDDEAIQNGLTVGGKKIELLPLPEAKAISEAELMKNFETARFGITRKVLLEIAERMIEIAQAESPDKDFDRLIDFAERIAHRYLGTGNAYTLRYNSSATHAFQDCLEYIPGDPEKNTTIITNHEYGGFTKYLRRKKREKRKRLKAPLTSEMAEQIEEAEETDPALKVVEFNNVEEQKPKTYQQFLDDILKEIETNGNTRIVIISTKTRLGDAPCTPEKNKSNIAQLAKVVKGIKEKHPTIAVVIDACQEVARSPHNYSLKYIGADIYLITGSKALGIGEAGLVAMKNNFLELHGQLDKWKGNDYSESTINWKNAIAMGLALRGLHRTEDPLRMEGNIGENRDKQLEEKMHDHLAKLTEYAIQRVESYGYDFWNKYENEFNETTLPDMEEKERTQLLGAEALHPIHRNTKNYTGILVLKFPTIIAKRLHPLLAKKYGILTTLLSLLDRYLHISFHYLHTEQHIDSLFNAIQETHKEAFLRIVKRNLEINPPKEGGKFVVRDIHKETP